MENHFTEFEGRVFHQQRGTAMGTSCAVVAACIYMFTVERAKVKEFQDQGLLLLRKRYIDDIFACFTTPEACNRFWVEFNNLRPRIKVSGVNGHSVPILDMEVYKGDRFFTERRLDIKLYQKPINQYLYLPYNSFHTRSARESFVTGELMRFVRLNTSHTNFLADRQRFYDRLRARGHPVAVLEKSFPKIVYSDRARFLATKPEALERKRITAFVTTLDPKTLALQLNKLAKENWHLVSNSKDTPTLKHIQRQSWLPTETLTRTTYLHSAAAYAMLTSNRRRGKFLASRSN